MLGFLFAGPSFSRDAADAAKLLETEDGRKVVAAAHDALAALPTWETAAIDEALRQALIEGLGLKPRHAFGPVRVAVTGRRISPPLFESLELLGRERSLDRLAEAAGR
jgi:glutamyl-tRNA synthetase